MALLAALSGTRFRFHTHASACAPFEAGRCLCTCARGTILCPCTGHACTRPDPNACTHVHAPVSTRLRTRQISRAAWMFGLEISGMPQVPWAAAAGHECTQIVPQIVQVHARHTVARARARAPHTATCARTHSYARCRYSCLKYYVVVFI